jgi:hypothetical protein
MSSINLNGLDQLYIRLYQECIRQCPTFVSVNTLNRNNKDDDNDVGNDCITF